MIRTSLHREPVMGGNEIRDAWYRVSDPLFTGVSGGITTQRRIAYEKPSGNAIGFVLRDRRREETERRTHTRRSGSVATGARVSKQKGRYEKLSFL